MDDHSGSYEEKRLLDMFFPPQCLLCGELVQTEGGLCGVCWRETPFILGLCCDLCGAPLIGDDPGMAVHCDDCREIGRPWRKGRSVMLYDGGARRLVLGLKHGDRLDLVPSLAKWMAVRCAPLVGADTVVAPVPVHWRRLLSRRYNQASVLSNALAKRMGLSCRPDLLQRFRSTQVQDGMGVEARFANLADSVRVPERHRTGLAGRQVLLVDDVMTSGATLDVCTRACLQAGADQVNVMTLARVVRDT